MIIKTLEEIDQELQHHLFEARSYIDMGDKVKAKESKDKYIEVLEYKKEHYDLTRDEKIQLKTLKLLRKVEGSKRLTNLMKRKVSKYQ